MRTADSTPSSIPTEAIYQDELPVGGQNFHVETFPMNFLEKLNPRCEDGGLDCRYTDLARQIVGSISQQTISELSELHRETSAIQDRYSRSGLRFVIGVFQVEMEDWQRKAFKKQLRSLLQECGFKPSMTTKLIASGEFIAHELPLADFNPDLDWCSEEQHRKQHEQYLEYLKGYGVSSLYLLSQMDYEGRRLARTHFDSTGHRFSTRELEGLKQQYARWSVDRQLSKRPASSSDNNALLRQVHELKAVEDCCEETPYHMIKQFVQLAQSIDWEAVEKETTSCQLLSSINETLGFIAALAHQVPCSPAI